MFIARRLEIINKPPNEQHTHLNGLIVFIMSAILSGLISLFSTDKILAAETCRKLGKTPSVLRKDINHLKEEKPSTLRQRVVLRFPSSSKLQLKQNSASIIIFQGLDKAAGWGKETFAWGLSFLFSFSAVNKD